MLPWAFRAGAQAALWVATLSLCRQGHFGLFPLLGESQVKQQDGILHLLTLALHWSNDVGATFCYIGLGCPSLQGWMVQNEFKLKKEETCAQLLPPRAETVSSSMSHLAVLKASKWLTIFLRIEEEKTNDMSTS